MEQLFGWLQQVTNGAITKESFSRFAWIDWVGVGFVVVGFFVGAKKGLMRELALIIESFVLIGFVFNFYGGLSTLCLSYLPKLPPMYVDPVVYLVLLILMFVIIHFWDSILKKMIQTQVTGILKVSGGAFLGMVYSLIVLSILAQFFLLIPHRAVRGVFEPENSVFGSTIAGFAHTVNDGLRHTFSLSFLEVKTSSTPAPVPAPAAARKQQAP